MVSAYECSLQHALDTTSLVGARFGLSLHYDKFQLLQVNGQFQVFTGNHCRIAAQDSMTYLGCQIYADGSLKLELNRKLGAAWSGFCALQSVCQHSTLSTQKKIQIFRAVIISRLLYELASAWLNKCEIRRLNGFFCRCLRVLLRIPPAY